jgi:glycerophosphoryl diester phosphodiesterase
MQSMREDPGVTPGNAAPRREVEVVAHRGASGTAPENTLTALREAADQGATFAEVDVVLSKDGVPVLAHDLTLERTTDVADVFPERTTWNVAEFTLAELRMLDAGAWFDQRFAGERIPTLREALRVFRGHGLGLWMELKSPDRHPRLAQAVADVLRTAPGGWLTAPDRDRWLKVTSFNFDVLADFVREVDHAVPVGGIAERVPDDATLRELAGWMEYFIPNYGRLRPGDIVRIRAAGLKAGFWTPNAPVSVASLLVQGADALIQNYPAVARAMVDGRDPLPGPAAVVIERVVGDVPDGGEHVLLRNLTGESVDVGGWYLRDDPGYRLPIGPDRRIAGGGTLAVHVGHGTHTHDRYYSGLATTVFSKGGDSVALHRPDGGLVDLAGNNLIA